MLPGIRPTARNICSRITEMFWKERERDNSKNSTEIIKSSVIGI